MTVNKTCVLSVNFFCGVFISTLEHRVIKYVISSITANVQSWKNDTVSSA